MSVQGPFMEYLRAINTLKGPNTYTEVPIACPTSKTELMAMLIHKIVFVPPTFETHSKKARKTGTTVADLDSYQAQITAQSQGGIRSIDNKDVIAKLNAKVSLGTVWHKLHEKAGLVWTFLPAVLHPRAFLYFGALTSGFSSAANFYVRIGYTLQRINREDFIAALVE